MANNVNNNVANNVMANINGVIMWNGENIIM